MRTLAFLLLLLLWSEKHSLMIQRYKMLSSRLDEKFLMDFISVWEFDEEKSLVHPKLDLRTTRFKDLLDLRTKTQLPSYFTKYHHSI